MDQNANPGAEPPLAPTASAPPAAPPAALPEATPVSPDTEGNRLEKVLPQIKDLAQKVGGYKKLADIARQLEGPSE